MQTGYPVGRKCAAQDITDSWLIIILYFVRYGAPEILETEDTACPKKRFF
jgi:hypothetical protein